MKRLLRSKVFWGMLLGKLIISTFVFSYLFPQATEAAAPPIICSVPKTWTFEAKKDRPFPATFTVPRGWSVRWENRPGQCVGQACIQSTIELNPGYIYDADRMVARQGSALKLIWIDKGSFGAGGDAVVDKLKERITYASHKTWVNPHQLLVTRGEGKLQGIGTSIPTQDYTVLMHGDEGGMLFLSLEDVTKENVRVAEALVKSLKPVPRK